MFAVTEGMEVRRTKVTGLKPATLYNIYVGALWPGGAGDSALVQVTTNAAPTPAAAPAAAHTATPATPPASHTHAAAPAATSHAAPAAAPAPANHHATTKPAAGSSSSAAAASAGKTAAAAATEHKPAPAPAPATPPAAAAAPMHVADSNPGCRHSQEPKAPVDFTATADGGSSIKLTYGNGDRSICTQHYSIDAYELKTGERVAEIETVYNAYTLTGLHRGVEYVFTVSAVNPAGDSVPDTAYCTI